MQTELPTTERQTNKKNCAQLPNAATGQHSIAAINEINSFASWE